MELHGSNDGTSSLERCALCDSEIEDSAETRTYTVCHRCLARLSRPNAVIGALFGALFLFIVGHVLTHVILFSLILAPVGSLIFGTIGWNIPRWQKFYKR